MKSLFGSLSLPSLLAFTCGAELKRLNDRVAPFIREFSSPFSRHKFWNKMRSSHQLRSKLFVRVFYKKRRFFYLTHVCQVSFSTWFQNTGKRNTSNSEIIVPNPIMSPHITVELVLDSDGCVVPRFKCFPIQTNIYESQSALVPKSISPNCVISYADSFDASLLLIISCFLSSTIRSIVLSRRMDGTHAFDILRRQRKAGENVLIFQSIIVCRDDNN